VLDEWVIKLQQIDHSNVITTKAPTTVVSSSDGSVSKSKTINNKGSGSNVMELITMAYISKQIPKSTQKDNEIEFWAGTPFLPRALIAHNQEMGVCGSSTPAPNAEEIDLSHFEEYKVVGKNLSSAHMNPLPHPHHP
jgi:hypothetical protein